MKKITSVLLTVCMLLLAVLSFSSCGHTHNFSSDWSKDADNHWHACDGCEEKADNAAHTYGDWTSVNSDQHKKVCECGAEVTDGHTWGEGEVTTQPTPDADGVETFTCTGCGATKTMPIEYGHVHAYGNWVSVSDTQHKKVCECDAEIVEEHGYGAATSISDEQHSKTCSACSKVLTESHSWDNGEVENDIRTYTCTACGETKSEVANPQIAVVNPYANVAWGADEQIRSMSHWHLLRQEEFDMAIEDGYRHFAISHYQPSTPRENLSAYFQNVPDNVVSSPNSEKPNSSNVGGVYHFNALGSYATGGGHNDDEKANLVPWQTKYDEVFANLKYPDGGGITINHPLYYPTQNLATIFEMLDYDDRVLGVEIYNGDYGLLNTGEKDGSGNYIKIHDTRFIDTWDAILSTGRRCWGFAVIDWYDPDVDKGSNVLLVDTSEGLTDEECLKAYRNGNFYMQVKDTGLKFTEIKYENGAVTVSVNKNATIKFVTQDGAVKTVTGTTATYVPTEDDIYVRVEAADADDADGRIFSNPFMFKTREEVAAEHGGSLELKNGSHVYDLNSADEGQVTTTVVWEKDGSFSTTDNGGTKYTIEWYSVGNAGPNTDGSAYVISKKLEIKSIKQGNSTEEATISWGGKTYAKGDIVYRNGSNYWLGLDTFMGWKTPSTCFVPHPLINPIAKNGEVATFEATFKVELGDYHYNGEYYQLADVFTLTLREGTAEKVTTGVTVAGGASNYVDVKRPGTNTYYQTGTTGRGKVGEEFTIRIEVTELASGNYQVKTLVNGVLIDTCEVLPFDVSTALFKGFPSAARDVSVTITDVKFLEYVDSYDRHNHTFADEWTTDADNHWHARTCNEHDGCSHVANKDFGAHEDANTDGRCDTCEKVLSGIITVDNPDNLTHTIPTTNVEAGATVNFTVSVIGNYGVHVTGATQVGDPTVDGDTKTYSFTIESVDPSATIRIEKKKEDVVNKVDYTALYTSNDILKTEYINVSGDTVSTATMTSHTHVITWQYKQLSGPSLDGTSYTFGRSVVLTSVKACGSDEETSFVVDGVTYSAGTPVDAGKLLGSAMTETATQVKFTCADKLTAPTADPTLRMVWDTDIVVNEGTLSGDQPIKILYTSNAPGTNCTSSDGYDIIFRNGNSVIFHFGSSNFTIGAVGDKINIRVEIRDPAPYNNETETDSGGNQDKYDPVEIKLYVNGVLKATRMDQVDASSGNYDTMPLEVTLGCINATRDVSINFSNTYLDVYTAN